MKRQTEGQSIVEMGLLLPLLLIVLFGIIEMGYYVYAYATIYQGARDGAEVAAGAPPFPARVSPIVPPGSYSATDVCTQEIIEAVRRPAALFDLGDEISITYPEYVMDPRTGDPLPPERRRQIGYPIEVGVRYNIQPITPLWSLIGINEERMPVFDVTARRTIEGFGRDPSNPNLATCEP